MDFKKSSAGKQSKHDVAGGVNAAMAPMNDWEEIDEEKMFQVMKQDSISKAVISMLNVLKGNATPAERVFTQEVINASGILISFEPMKAKPKKKSFLKKLFSKKPKVKQVTPKFTQEQVKKKLSLYLQSPDTRETILHDRLLMARLMQDAQKNDEIKAVLDDIYVQIGDAKVLMQLIKARFGVSLIDNTLESIQALDQDVQDNDEAMNYLSQRKSGKPLAWSIEALKTIYKTYIHVPTDHLAEVKFIMHTSDTNPSSVSYNQKGMGLGVYEVNYVKGNEHLKLDANKHMIDANDMDNDKELIPLVTAHELGHVVDHAKGNLSGEGKAMRKVSNWIEIKDDAETVLNFMEASISGPLYGGLLNNEELKIAHDVAKKFLTQTVSAATGNWDELCVKCKNLLKNTKSAGANVSMDNLINVMLDKDIDSNVLYHCWRGRADNFACYNFNDQMRGMNRPFHQGYKRKSWYSFDQSRWNDKISQYQYRDPIEEFAETYASFHAAPACGKKKGEMTPKPLLQWFLKEGLDKSNPQVVKDPGKKVEKGSKGSKKKS